MARSPKVTLVGETKRLVSECASEIGDIWRHEGFKKFAEYALYQAGNHDSARSLLEWASESYDPKLKTSLGGLALVGPVGIAAGWDKRSRTLRAWESLGADFMVPGAVNFYGQPGNSMPRLKTFDNYVGDHGKSVALNSIGFNCPDVKTFVRNTEQQRENGGVYMPVIPQVTVNKEFYDPANRHMIPGMIAATIKEVMPIADGIELGLTSPNTLGMREAQDGDEAEEFIYGIIMRAKEEINGRVPLSYKADGDGGEERLEMYARLIKRTELDIIGLINSTALARVKAKYGAQNLPGGLSGADPDYQRLADHAVKYMYEAVGDKVDIYAMGGVNSGERALRLMKLGAKAVAINTAVRQRGPLVVAKIKRELSANPEVRQVNSIEQLIGSDTSRGPIAKQVA